MDPISSLQRLVSYGRFVGSPETDANGYLTSLTYVRWFDTGHADVVLVHSPQESAAFRAAGIDPHAPLDMSRASIRWRLTGPVGEVVAEVLERPTPGGKIVVPGTKSSRGERSSLLWVP